jgi:hypothetical protein
LQLPFRPRRRRAPPPAMYVRVVHSACVPWCAVAAVCRRPAACACAEFAPAPVSSRRNGLNAFLRSFFTRAGSILAPNRPSRVVADGGYRRLGDPVAPGARQRGLQLDRHPQRRGKAPRARTPRPRAPWSRLPRPAGAARSLQGRTHTTLTKPALRREKARPPNRDHHPRHPYPRAHRLCAARRARGWCAAGGRRRRDALRAPQQRGRAPRARACRARCARRRDAPRPRVVRRAAAATRPPQPSRWTGERLGGGAGAPRLAGPGPHAGLSGSVLQEAARPRSAALRPPSARPAGPSCRPPAHLPNSSNSCPWDVALCVSAALARVLPAEAAAAGGTFAGVLRAAHAAIVSGDSAAAQAAREEFFELVRARARAGGRPLLLLSRAAAPPPRVCYLPPACTFCAAAPSPPVAAARTNTSPPSPPPPRRARPSSSSSPGRSWTRGCWWSPWCAGATRVGAAARVRAPSAATLTPQTPPFPHARARHARRSASCRPAWRSWRPGRMCGRRTARPAPCRSRQAGWGRTPGGGELPVGPPTCMHRKGPC